MAYKVTIVYNPDADIFNAKVQKSNIVTPAAIPGITANEMPGEYVGPSKAYLYAADSATAPQYLKENLAVNSNGAIGADANLSLLTSSQLRWPKSVTNSIMNILEAYRTPQVPVYRAWQTIKLAITGGTYEFAVDTYEAAQFYKELNDDLANYGITVTVAVITP